MLVFSLYMKSFDGHHLPHKVVASGLESELVHVLGNELDIDPHYVLYSAQENLRASFGYTGMVQEIAIDRVPIVSRRNAYGDFVSEPGVDIGAQIDTLYNQISGMVFISSWVQERFNWTYQRLLARFADFLPFVSGQIIPDYSDTMLVVPLADGCIDDCSWCTYARSEAGFFQPRPIEQVRSSILELRDVVRRYHNIADFHEVNFAASDIFWFKLLGLEDPMAQVQYFLEQMPGRFDKRSGFFGIRSAIQIMEKFESQAHSEYFRDIFRWFNRGLIGIETLDTAISFREGKKITAQEKVDTVRYFLSDTPVKKLKLIVQIGLDEQENLSITAEGLAQLVKQYNRGNEPRVTIELSMHIPKRGYAPVDDAMIANASQGFEIFSQTFRNHHLDLTALRRDYEMALVRYQRDSRANS